MACGTSWHAGLIGKQYLETFCRVPVEVAYASEFRYSNPVIDDSDVVIAISQSGETADTLAAIELAKSRGEEFSFDDAKPLLTECFGFYFGDDRDNPMRVRSAEKKQLEEAFGRQFKGENRSHSAFAVTALKCFNNKASIGWTSDAHTALPVITSAFGAGAETFSGAIDNTDISKKLKKLVK